MLLKDILIGVDYKILSGSPDTDISGVTDDSRSASSGGLFIAVKGYARDGSKFIDEAVAKGVSAVISDSKLALPEGVTNVSVADARKILSSIAVNFYGDPSERLKVIGITGTNGKTTITYIIESIIKSLGAGTGVIGTVNYRIAGNVKPAKNTTPGSLELQSLLSEMVRAGLKYAVMEVSSHALDQERVSGVKFDAGVFTNITSDHLDYHKTVSEYFRAKARIFSHLKKDGAAIINYDDGMARSLKTAVRAKVLTYGASPASDIKAVNIRTSIDGSAFDAVTPSGSFTIESGLVGMHNISNCLAAIAVSQILGINNSTIADGIKALGTIPGRLEPVEKGQAFKVFVDYAHTEDALSNVLSMLKKSASARILTVFGCGGDRDRSKRPLMGAAACRFSDMAIVTSDNPRFEDPMEIIRDIEAGIKGHFSNYDIVPDRREAIQKAISAAKDGDIVLIAGKGHEDYQIVKDSVTHFDDREVAAEMLTKKSER